jgi:predicted nucleotidyltransferase
MPDDEAILGFTNKWYATGIKTAVAHKLPNDLTIRLLTPPLFIATKLEAYNGRGNNDPSMSHDLEDILILIDGRRELIAEIEVAPDDVRIYIAKQFHALLYHDQFEHAVLSNVRGDEDRMALTYDRMNSIADMRVED